MENLKTVIWRVHAKNPSRYEDTIFDGSLSGFSTSGNSSKSEIKKVSQT